MRSWSEIQRSSQPFETRLTTYTETRARLRNFGPTFFVKGNSSPEWPSTSHGPVRGKILNDETIGQSGWLTGMLKSLAKEFDQYPSIRAYPSVKSLILTEHPYSGILPGPDRPQIKLASGLPEDERIDDLVVLRLRVPDLFSLLYRLIFRGPGFVVAPAVDFQPSRPP